MEDSPVLKESKEISSQIECTKFDWMSLRNKQTMYDFPWDNEKKLNIDLILDNIMESLLILLCGIMILQLSRVTLYSQVTDAEVSRSEISSCPQMYQNDNSDWV